jgi:L-cysteine:1D-myo-inositol 2-amino-2-deoxy-alpha-D-glucopyranoside ligase
VQLYNTLTRRKEPFAPLDGRTVRMYVCGITPYDTTHIGHALTYLTFDLLHRACRRRGWLVRYTQNVTDVDDDIIRKARQVGEAWDRLGDRYTQIFQEDLNALNVLAPDCYPRASDEIETIVAMVAALIERGNAYERDGAVFFRAAGDPGYGRLSGLGRDEMIRLSAERGADPADPRKEDPLDFILWQLSEPGEPSWASPWGQGRPGWHIECSAMAWRHLGPQIDVHGGGGDLIYPHHESEIAQSEAFTGRPPFARVWMHVGMVRYGGEKMSKSLGNLVLVRDVVRRLPADALRLYLHGHHYRESFEYEDDGPAAFLPLVERLREASRAADGDGPPLDLGGLTRRFWAAIDDDLNTPDAVGILGEMTDAVLAGAAGGRRVADARAALREAGSALGLTATR